VSDRSLERAEDALSNWADAPATSVRFGHLLHQLCGTGLHLRRLAGNDVVARTILWRREAA
jgi:hypothetical protein